MRILRRHPDATLFLATSVLLACGLIPHALGAGGGWHQVATGAWVLSAVTALALSVGWVIAAALRREATVDVIALLALAGTLAVGEPLAGAVIAWMLATGRVLEERAQARATRELSLLVERAPRRARRRRDRDIEDIPVDEIARGDVLVVGPGEIIPVDGHLLGPAVLDESALTGEALPVDRASGSEVRSGCLNAGGPLTLVATSATADSTYAHLIRLVAQARASSAPFVRAADRVAVAFVPITLVLAGCAWWAAGDPVRAVAVLVVATPCPLLLAAPIAFMSGLSRAARAGVVIKGGAALERLAAGKVLMFDKTGTLTQGSPQVVGIVVADPDPAGTSLAGPESALAGSGGVDATELLRLAASLDQVSPHVLAGAIVLAGRARGLRLELPEDVADEPGYGIQGTVAGRRVRIGRASWILADRPSPWARRLRRRAALDGSLSVYVSVDGVPAGALLLEDPIRPDAPRMVRALRRAGLERIVLVTGDRADIAEAVGRVVGVDAVHAEHDPAEKLAVVLAESRIGPTVMVGDGVNDAPALAAAGVGVALAARGATASSQAADVVLTVDRVDGLATAIELAHRSRSIAVQSVGVGMGLSMVAMGAAALGLLPPTAGALLQELIDVIAILLALRAVLPAHSRKRLLTGPDAEVVSALQDEHTGIRPLVEEIRQAADQLGARDDLDGVRQLLDRLEGRLLPHERAEERLLHPVMARVLGGDDPTAALSRAHAEIEHQVARLQRLMRDIDAEGGITDPEDGTEVQRLLYGLHAVMRLHNAQEDELYSRPEMPPPGGTRAAADAA